MFQIFDAVEKFYPTNRIWGTNRNESLGFYLTKALRDKEFTTIDELVKLVKPQLESKVLYNSNKWVFVNSILSTKEFTFFTTDRFYKFNGRSEVLKADGIDVNRWQNGVQELYEREIVIDVRCTKNLTEARLDNLRKQGVNVIWESIF